MLYLEFAFGFEAGDPLTTLSGYNSSLRINTISV